MYSFKNILAIGILFSCINNLRSQAKTPYRVFANGIGIKIHTQGKGALCKPSFELTMRYAMAFHPDTILDQSNSNFKFILGEREGLKGWDFALQQLHVGDSATCYIPDSLAYNGKRLGRHNTQRPLILYVKILDQRPVYFNFQKPVKDSISVSPGIKKIILKSGKTPVHALNYVVFTITGYIKTNEGYRRRFIQGDNTTLGLNMQLGSHAFIDALDKALLSMNIGEQAHFIIEPVAGLHNDKKQSGIPPNSRLFFDIELQHETNPFQKINVSDTLMHNAGFCMLVNSEKRKNITQRLNTEDEQLLTSQGYYFKMDASGNRYITSNTYLSGRPFIFRTTSMLFHVAFIKGFKYLHPGDEALLIYDSVPASGGIEKQGLYLENVSFMPFPFYKEDALKRQKQGKIEYQNVLTPTHSVIAQEDDTLTIRFTGYYKTGNGNRRIFDSSLDLQRGFTFVLNNKTILPGLKEGLLGMCTGGQRIIYVPYALAYGTEGLPARGIPAKTDLIFDVHIIHISKHKP